ncbi:hypothetical protein DES53_115153 [Roseimicrobium gellanilyticum]|uniref:Large polyvalent protein associated domain-containing protein n=1 Tax=Roseimicrobium gellanilyticum TaxID=748857 RepID=A0A366H5V0_9BACT|nr:hypothetical protein [Roseimicrobium gellanilyticum]RBP37012.1 hypothetical protein DES53_115153 [Roseimicrobium gellanilyticum]
MALPLISEEDALEVMGLYDLLPETEKGKAKDYLSRYKRQQDERVGFSFPNLLEKQMREEEQFFGLFSDVKNVDRMNPLVGTAARYVDDADLLRKQEASVQFIKRRMPSAPEQHIREHLGLYMSGYGSEVWDEPGMTDAGRFFDFAKTEVDEERKIFEFEKANSESMGAAAISAAYKGESKWDAFDRWIGAIPGAKDLYPNELLRFQTAFNGAHSNLELRLMPHEDAIISTVNDLQVLMGVKQGAGSDWRVVAERMLKVPEEDREDVINAIMVRGAPDGDYKEWAQKTAESLGRGIVDLVGGTFLVGQRNELLIARENIDRVIKQVEEGRASAFDFVDIFGNGRAVSSHPDSLRELRAEVDKALDFDDMLARMHAIGEGTIDPIKGNWFSSGFYGMVRSAPQMLASFHPLGWMAMTGQFAEGNYQRIRREQPGMPRAWAQSIAIWTAPGQALVETVSNRFLLGRLPNLLKLARTPATTWAGQLKGLWILGPKSVVEYGEEKAQHFAPYYTQQLVAALSKDVADAPWELAFQGWEDGHTELVSTVIWMTVVGHGVGTSLEVGAMREQARHPLLLEAAGFSEESALRISDAARRDEWGEVDTMMREEHAAGRIELDGANLIRQRDAAALLLREEAQRRGVAVSELEKIGALPVLSRAGDGSYQLTFDDGSRGRYRTAQEAVTAMRDWTGHRGDAHDGADARGVCEDTGGHGGGPGGGAAVFPGADDGAAGGEDGAGDEEAGAAARAGG